MWTRQGGSQGDRSQKGPSSGTLTVHFSFQDKRVKYHHLSGNVQYLLQQPCKINRMTEANKNEVNPKSVQRSCEASPCKAQIWAWRWKLKLCKAKSIGSPQNVQSLPVSSASSCSRLPSHSIPCLGHFGRLSSFSHAPVTPPYRQPAPSLLPLVELTEFSGVVHPFPF